MSDPVTLESHGNLAVIRLDDGKANALSHAVIDQLNTALDDAGDADAVVLFGRAGKFSAGFDLSVMKDGIEAAQELTGRGAELCMRLYGHHRPVLAGADGHALAAGALVLLSCDVRIGSADTPAKIGLPEIAIGMTLPHFLVALSEDRLSKRHLSAATLLAQEYNPETAVDAGFLDAIVPQAELESTVLARAEALASTLNGPAFAASRAKVRGATIERVLSNLTTDMSSFQVLDG
ncbi:MAG: crotonase/enoyl-CoA hydratase family protein [Actinomycetota bacterium]